MGLLENVEFNYPKELVNEYGAKAGLLMHIANHLPHIPQMPMVVKKLGEPAKDFLARVDQADIPWPRLFRSSATAELVGFEGAFPTHWVDTFKGEGGISTYFIKDGKHLLLENEIEFNIKVEDLVEEIANSPQKVESEDLLPPEINVIAAELASCRHRGVLIKHPNRSDYYLTTLVSKKDFGDKLTLSYRPGGGFSRFGEDWRNSIELAYDLEKQLEAVVEWHDEIAKILDPNWVYVLEFGLMPSVLFQAHYFKQVQEADFRFDSQKGGPWEPVVIGITDKEGEDYELFNLIGQKQTDLPSLIYTNLHYKSEHPESPGYLFNDCAGILAHKDVMALRQSKISLLYPRTSPNGLQDGMIINVASDGFNARLTNKLTGKEIS